MESLVKRKGSKMLPNISIDFATTVISFLFTIMVLSYLIGDNPFFRMAVYVFIGVSAGYAASVAWHNIIWPRLIVPLLSGVNQQSILLLIPLLMGLLLLLKLFPGTSRLGNPVMAFLVGVTAAIVISGAVLGTVIPQSMASIEMFNLYSGGNIINKIFEGTVFLIGTVSTLVYFQYTSRKTPKGISRGRVVEGMAWLGKIFLAITFGVIFAGVLTSALTALIERITFIWSFLQTIL